MYNVKRNARNETKDKNLRKTTYKDIIFFKHFCLDLNVQLKIIDRYSGVNQG